MGQLMDNTTLQGGKYKIVRFLSSGGFGNTYEGVHTMMDTRVAIKEFFPKMFCNRDENTSHVTVATQGNRELVDKLRKKFNEEAKAIFQMKHDNIVRVLDIFEENGTAYYVMEYIDGMSLNDITKERGALPEAEAVGYIRQVADALKYVHSLNRLHLDIKPGNIMVDKNGKAILIDFGASKHYDDESGENTSTLMGVNTKGYAPIEQSTQSFTTFSPATDIYALGATLYKLLTGVTPPDANMILAEEEALQPLPSNISASTRSAVLAAMQMKRKDRPQSVEQFFNLMSLSETTSNKRTKISTNKISATKTEDTLFDPDDKIPNEVKKLCELTGESQSICERTLKQVKGNFKAALIKLQTDQLYTKYGDTDLGIGRGTCKKYIEQSNGSIVNAEKELEKLCKQRKKDVNSLFSDYKDIIDDFDMETCQKIYTEANCNKEKAENKLLEVYTDKVITSNTSNTVYQHSIWDSIKDFFEEVIGTLIICGLVVLGIYTYKSCDSTNDSVQEITYKNGDTYKGELKDGKFNGHGTYTWAKKEGNLLYKYDGNWVDGHREGQGVGYYADGAIYEGQWGANGVACYGVMTWPWEKIANTLKLYKYEGYFVNGLISGEGTAYYGNHKYQKGIWKNGKLVRKTEEGDWK